MIKASPAVDPGARYLAGVTDRPSRTTPLDIPPAPFHHLLLLSRTAQRMLPCCLAGPDPTLPPPPAVSQPATAQAIPNLKRE